MSWKERSLYLQLLLLVRVAGEGGAITFRSRTHMAKMLGVEPKTMYKMIDSAIMAGENGMGKFPKHGKNPRKLENSHLFTISEHGGAVRLVADGYCRNNWLREAEITDVDGVDQYLRPDSGTDLVSPPQTPPLPSSSSISYSYRLQQQLEEGEERRGCGGGEERKPPCARKPEELTLSLLPDDMAAGVPISVRESRIWSDRCEQVRLEWNQVCTDQRKCQKIGPARKRAIVARWKSGLQNIQQWRHLFKAVHASDYLNGRNQKNGRPSWFSFDWVLKENNMQKILEGNYGNDSGTQRFVAGTYGGTTGRVDL